MATSEGEESSKSLKFKMHQKGKKPRESGIWAISKFKGDMPEMWAKQSSVLGNDGIANLEGKRNIIGEIS